MLRDVDAVSSSSQGSVGETKRTGQFKSLETRFKFLYLLIPMFKQTTEFNNGVLHLEKTNKTKKKTRHQC